MADAVAIKQWDRYDGAEGDDWWQWTVWIEGPERELDLIDSVEWALHPSFPKPIRTVYDRKSKFCLDAAGWEGFTITAHLNWSDTRVTKLTHELVLHRPTAVPLTPAYRPTKSSPGRHRVVLVPGLFGFGSLGQLTYFVGVREALERAFTQLDLDVDVVELPTLPTASIRHRAARVHEVLAQLTEAGPGPIHIVGHSTGGLDARLAITPTASLPTMRKFSKYDQVRTLVSICTPHFGTPLGSFYGGRTGNQLLRVFALLATWGLRYGHVPLQVGLKAARVDDLLGFRTTVADDFFAGAIAGFAPEKRAELLAFIDGLSNDPSLMFELTPQGCDLFNASTADPDGLYYGSVVCCAQPPAVSNVLAFKYDAYLQLMHALYASLHYLAACADQLRAPQPTLEQRQVLELAFGKFPEVSWSDGIVPVLSQVWGEVIHATRADHLDVVGHFGGERHSDWLPSRSGFDAAAFDDLWSDVAGFIAESARHTDSRRDRRNVGVERTRVDLNPRHGSAHASEVVTASARAREAFNELPPSAQTGTARD
jgi:hypothetical protein